MAAILGRAGKVGSFSFSVSKVVTTARGGCLITDDHDVANRLRRLKDSAELLVQPPSLIPSATISNSPTCSLRRRGATGKGAPLPRGPCLVWTRRNGEREKGAESPRRFAKGGSVRDRDRASDESMKLPNTAPAVLGQREA